MKRSQEPRPNPAPYPDALPAALFSRDRSLSWKQPQRLVLRVPRCLSNTGKHHGADEGGVRQSSLGCGRLQGLRSSSMLCLGDFNILGATTATYRSPGGSVMLMVWPIKRRNDRRPKMTVRAIFKEKCERFSARNCVAQPPIWAASLASPGQPLGDWSERHLQASRKRQRVEVHAS